ncbi:hypothetical protein G6048_01980 [Streptomyces sp. YC419]|uniref:L,D-transpeptidase n=1 Tax=Streptomyces ureilyticus TaxID=1775131 RepID=A0ABX0DGH5_9ACTN|nr:hypothetical protein [Streptomyces ureilyticus]
MAGLTVAAVAAVGFLAYQASANVPDTLGAPDRTSSSPGASAPSPRAKPNTAAALPGRSGSGQRVVYSVQADRVWLVAANDKVTRTFSVTPGTVDPAPDTYTVTSRSGSITGSDGVAVEHVVRFASVDGTTIGFSAAVDGSTPAPDTGKKLGGIRESRADGDAMWEFATVGTKVVVVE